MRGASGDGKCFGTGPRAEQRASARLCDRDAPLLVRCRCVPVAILADDTGALSALKADAFSIRSSVDLVLPPAH